MTRNALPTEALEAIEAAGFTAYMRNRTDSWCLYTDGQRIAMLQRAFLAGYTISTVHKPNRTTGTGWQMFRGTFDLTPDNLAAGFKDHPGGATTAERASIHKYAGIDDYRAESRFNADYAPVSAKEDRAARDHAANNLALFIINDRDIYQRYTLPALRASGKLHPCGEPMSKILRHAYSAWAHHFGEDDPQLDMFRREDVREEAAAQIVEHYADHEEA